MNPPEQFNEADYLDILGASRAINGAPTRRTSTSSLTTCGSDFRGAKTRRIRSGNRAGGSLEVALNLMSRAPWTKHRRQDRAGL